MDAVLRGGPFAGRIYLIEGRPGTGKTTIGLRFLTEDVAKNDVSLYITLSESREELVSTATNHGWDVSRIQIEELAPVPVNPHAEQSILQPSGEELTRLVGRIIKCVKDSGAARVVIDSMSEVRLLAHDSSHYRRQIIALRTQLSTFAGTVLLLDDSTADGARYELQSAVHGVIALEQRERTFGSARRMLRVVKLRGGDFQSGWHDFAITEREVLVFPSLIAEEHHRQFEPEELLSGVSELDELSGGGIQFGTSTMILGPSGVGKSTLALQYGLALIKAGHAGAYFTFDESEMTLRSRMIARMGAAEDEKLAPRFLINRINPSRISPGEFIWKVRRHVEDHHVKLVIIDSINSYLDVIKEERSLLLQMNELFSYLANMGVMSIIVGAHSANLDTSREPDALTIITDNMFSLRFYEEDGELKKAIAVVKKRHSKHSLEVREFKLVESGVEIGRQISKAVITGGEPHNG